MREHLFEIYKRPPIAWKEQHPAFTCATARQQHMMLVLLGRMRRLTRYDNKDIFTHYPNKESLEDPYWGPALWTKVLSDGARYRPLWHMRNCLCRNNAPPSFIYELDIGGMWALADVPGSDLWFSHVFYLQTCMSQQQVVFHQALAVWAHWHKRHLQYQTDHEVAWELTAWPSVERKDTKNEKEQMRKMK